MNINRVLLTDVDNTLFSWIDFFAPCFRALVHAVSRESKIPEEELYDAFQLTFKKEGSVEYRRAIQDNLAIQELAVGQQAHLVELGAKVFGMAMRKHLHPYDGVRSTLQRLRADGVHVVAVTNSGALQAVDRIRRLGLAKQIDGLVAWDHDVAQVADSSIDYQDVLRSRTSRSGIPWTITLDRESLKPSPMAYNTALERLGLGDALTWVIGDSLEKDLSGAAELRAHSIWAEYGHHFDPKNFETLVRITHWSADKIERTYDRDVLVPDSVVHSFSELLEIIEMRQGELF